MNTTTPIIKSIQGATNKKLFFFIALFLFAAASALKAQNYTICSTNYVLNSTFTRGVNNSTTVVDWTFSGTADDVRDNVCHVLN
ncbi:MAG: hypothetical protein Q4G63_00875 [Bacteroidia bacterium]|nr:hypothetical protein [Bacteroidia bacterium]